MCQISAKPSAVLSIAMMKPAAGVLRHVDRLEAVQRRW
jgi:hypothetical protein